MERYMFQVIGSITKWKKGPIRDIEGFFAELGKRCHAVGVQARHSTEEERRASEAEAEAAAAVAAAKGTTTERKTALVHFVMVLFSDDALEWVLDVLMRQADVEYVTMPLTRQYTVWPSLWSQEQGVPCRGEK